MRTELSALGREEIAVLARLRVEVSLGLIALAAAADPALGELAAARRFGLRISLPGGRGASLLNDGQGLLRLAQRGEGRISLSLRFPTDLAAVRLLSGAKAPVLPLPRGPGAGAALAFFRAAATRAPALLRPGAASPELRALLLAGAALRGLCAVGNADPALRERLAHLPSGRVAVLCAGVFALGIEKTGDGLSYLDAAPESPNARLAFRDAAAAVEVLGGARPAVLALADGGVTIGGYLPVIQGLFAVLDRLGEYMAVKVEE